MKAVVVDRLPAPREAEDPDRVVRLYKRLRSLRAVARRLDRSTQLVRDVLRALGVAVHNEGTRDPRIRGLYAGWRAMIRRCDDPSHRSYAHYGARSIGYCDAWKSFPSFREWALANGWRRGRHLLLRDPDKGHSPTNCYWGTHTEMLRLRTRFMSLTDEPVRAFGVEKSAWSWARDPRCRVTYNGLLQRLRRGWPADAAITLPNRAPAPARLVKPRAIRRMRGRIDWDRVVALYRAGQKPEAIASQCRCAASTVYEGLKERRVFAAPKVTRRRLDDGPLYGTWNRMRRACAGRDVGRRDERVPTMVAQWESYPAFREWARSQGYRRGQCLVRILPRLPYAPANCRFVERSEVIFHARPPPPPTGHPRYLIRALGTAKSMAEWVRDPRCSITAITIARRIRAGWSTVHAITDAPMKPGASGLRLRVVRAFGQTKSLVEWSRDPRCEVTASGLANRLDRGLEPVAAIATPPYALRGDEKRSRRR